MCAFQIETHMVTKREKTITIITKQSAQHIEQKKHTAEMKKVQTDAESQPKRANCPFEGLILAQPPY